ncbi:14632_t:CDS:1, partial [Gigaspora rosea]
TNNATSKVIMTNTNPALDAAIAQEFSNTYTMHIPYKPKSFM